MICILPAQMFAERAIAEGSGQRAARIGQALSILAIMLFLLGMLAPGLITMFTSPSE